MANAIRLNASFNMAALISDLNFAKENCRWVPVFERGIGNAWKGVAFRSYDGNSQTLSYQDGPCKDTPLMETLNNVRAAVDFFQCDKKRVRFLSLLPGAKIGEHKDVLEGEQTRDVRLHIPFQTNDDALFYIEGQQLHMEVGELWYMDISRTHSVINQGRDERIHLVIDCVRNDWLDNMMAMGIPADFEKYAPK
jgi:hypothetical protein